MRLATSLRSVRKRPMVLLPPALLVLAWFYPSTVSDLGTQDHAVALVTAAMAATGLGLVMGLAGQFSLGQAAFMLVSGYTAAILTADHHWDPLLALVVAVTASVLVGVIVGMLTLRLEGLNLALATLAVLVIAIVFVSNDAGLTHGTAGVQNIPGLTIFGSTINSSAAFFRLALVLLAAMLLIARNIWKSRIGRALKAIGIDQVAAESVGLTSDTLKLRIFVLGGAMAGVGGVLSAYYLRFVAPNSWDVGLTINLVTYLVVGGLFSPYGGAVGAALIGTLLYYIQQHVGASTSGGASSWDVVASGVLLIVSLLVFRRGLTAVPTLAAERISRWRGRATSKEGNGATGPRAANGTRLEPATRVPALDQITAPDPLKADTPVVVVEGLTKRFGGFTAVSELSFTLRPGYVTALIGPNGAGKSTVIDMLSGTLVASAGAVGIMGKPMAGLAPQQVARLGVARTFQTPRLFEGMTLLETVMIARDRHGGRFWLLDGALRTPWGIRSERLARDQALAWLAYVGLEDDAHRPATSLPVGKQRMAEVARALATEPSVLLLDEPAAGLDGTETLALADEIRALGDAGIAVLLVEHDMSMVMSIADRVIVLEQGKKIAEGPPEVVQSDQTVIDAYLGVVAA